MKLKKSLLALSFLIMANCSSTKLPTLEAGEKAPLTKFRLLSGDYVTIQENKGKKTAILFWAEWCSKSRTELSRFEEIAQKYNGNSKYTFIAANVDEWTNLEKVESRIQDLKIPATRVAFSGNEGLDEAFTAFRGRSLPLVFLVNEEGAITVSEERVKYLEEHL